MEEQKYYIKISPEVIKSDIRTVVYTASTGVTFSIDQECCDFTSFTPTYTFITGQTNVILPMSVVVTGGTGNTSLMTGLTIPILFTQNNVDIGYYSVFDGAIVQKDVITNFLFSASSQINTTTYYVYNTSNISYFKFLQGSVFKIDWGDGSQIQTLSNFTPDGTPHIYPNVTATYTIRLSGITMFGLTVVEKKVNVPCTDVVITNPNGTAYFIPQGGSWSGVPISYDYIFSGDSNTNIQDHISANITTVPFLVTGFTRSSLNDLSQYTGNVNIKGKQFKLNQQVVGTNNIKGIYKGSTNDGLGVAYAINDVDYYDYNDGTTIFVVNSSGLTSDWLVSSGLTKDETLMNIIDQPLIFSNVYIERGKYSVFEKIRRLGEVSTIGGLESYGYGYFNVNKNNT